MGSVVPTSAMRPSLTERERVLERLRVACGDERLSLDTFTARVDAVYTARNWAELEAVIADLPEPGRIGRWAMSATAWASHWAYRFADAWRRPRVQLLVLPVSQSVLIGRSRLCACVVPEESVSRRHALVTHRDGKWWLRDLGSMNGTFVNGARVIDEIEIRPGDDVDLGRVGFRLMPPPASS
jgi:hypothetical protein